MRATREALLSAPAPMHLEEHMQIPTYASQGLFKCRVLYSYDIQQIDFVRYEKKQIQSLKLVYDNHIDYRYKYADRSGIAALFAQREDCDDILIVKKGEITDTSYCNIIFYDGHRWVTPMHPLLKGIQRQKLLDEHLITATDIGEADLNNYTCFKLINALNEMPEAPALPIHAIKK